MANIVLRLTSGSGSDTATEPNASLGGAMGTNVGAVITTASTTLNNLFDNISKLENSDGIVDHRCIMIHNDTAISGAVFAGGSVYVDEAANTKAGIQIGFGSATKNTPETIIADEKNVPAGVVFGSHTSGNALTFPTDMVLNPGDYLGVWIRREAQNVSGSGTVTDIINLVVRGVE
ncbi:MAG: hypothetical protein DRQ78_00025 [Epsilonproteobacteria bacterium]|nr:MAG: hypothetical protein DRQ78_00025 [Campylobacterota bacterium]